MTKNDTYLVNLSPYLNFITYMYEDRNWEG